MIRRPLTYRHLRDGEALLTIPRSRWDGATSETRELVEAAARQRYSGLLACWVIVRIADLPELLSILPAPSAGTPRLHVSLPVLAEVHP